MASTGRTRLGSLAATVVTVLLVGTMALPFFWMLSTSLKHPSEAVTVPPEWFPETPRWQNYRDAWVAAPFDRFLFNSLITSIFGATLQVGVAALMAYAFVFIRVPGRHGLFALVMMSILIPEELKLVPNYLLMDSLNWIDTYAALIFPPAAHAFPVLVLTIQLRTIPKDLFNAAKVDGAGHFRLLTQVAVPSSAPMLAALFLIAFLGRWNDYLWPLVVTNTEAMRTLPVGLAYLRSSQEGSVQWPLLMAAASFVTVPIMALFILTQRTFVEGILTGGLKG